MILEKDDKGNAFVPTFINSRIYIDLSSDDIFEDEYEKLIRNIFDKPAIKKPPIGNPPPYILQEEPIFLKTSNKVNAIKNALINEKKNFQVFIDDYYSTFIETLSDYDFGLEEIKKPPYIDDLILDKIEKLKDLRNDFIYFLETVLSYSYNFDIEKFIKFLEKIILFLVEKDADKYDSNLYGYQKIEHYRFFFYELFIYISTIMIEKDKFKELGKILNSDFIIFDERQDIIKRFSFAYFNKDIESFKDRVDRLKLQRISLTADLIKQRVNNKKYPFKKILEIDTLLYYVSILNCEDDINWLWDGWFPHTTAYNINSIPLIEKLVSLRHFEKIKFIFDVTTIEELEKKVLNAIKNNADRINRFNYQFPRINRVFDFKKIGQYK